jgi:hypothetical protein
MPEVYPSDVAALVTEGGDPTDAAANIIPLVTAMARAYTRGRGFDDEGRPNTELAAVITTASLRFLANPKQSSESEAVGPFTRDRRSRGFEGWTLAEQFVLNRHRKRAM